MKYKIEWLGCKFSKQYKFVVIQALLEKLELNCLSLFPSFSFDTATEYNNAPSS